MQVGDLVRLVPRNGWATLAAEKNGYLWLVKQIGVELMLCQSIATGDSLWFFPLYLEQANEEG